MFDNVSAFEGDSTTIKIFPLPAPVTFTAALAVFFVLFSFLTLASVAADDFLDAGIVITPV